MFSSFIIFIFIYKDVKTNALDDLFIFISY